MRHPVIIAVMTDRRAFIRRVLQGARTDRVPRALYGAGRWACRQTGMNLAQLEDKPAFFADTLADLFLGLDTDIVFAGSGLNTLPAEAIGGALAFSDEQAPLLSFPLIEKAGDAAGFPEVDISHSPRTVALIEAIARLRERLPDRFLTATSWGPFTWAMVLCEWNLLREKTCSDRAFIRELCELGIRLSCAFFEPLVRRGLIDGIALPDGAATLIPNDLYLEVVRPCEKALFAWAHDRGLACFLHQCGNIGPQLALYPETGADCISLDSCISIGEAYALYKDRTVTAGNVDVVNTVLAGDPARISAAVVECIAGIADPFQRYILMPSCDLPPDTPPANVREFLACADRISPERA